MSTLTEVLERIAVLFTSKQYSFVDFQSGLTSDEIARQLCRFPFQLPAETREFYQWRNAPNNNINYKNGEFSFWDHVLGNAADFVILLPIAEAISEYKILSEFDTSYNPMWFPILCYEYGTYVVFGSQLQVNLSPVIRVESDSKPEIHFPSLTNMMLAIAECLEEVGSINGNPSTYGKIGAIAEKYGSASGGIIIV